MNTYTVTFRFESREPVTVSSNDYQLDESGRWFEFVNDVDDEHESVVALFSAHDVVSIVTK